MYHHLKTLISSTSFIFICVTHYYLSLYFKCSPHNGLCLCIYSIWHSALYIISLISNAHMNQQTLQPPQVRDNDLSFGLQSWPSDSLSIQLLAGDPQEETQACCSLLPRLQGLFITEVTYVSSCHRQGPGQPLYSTSKPQAPQSRNVNCFHLLIHHPISYLCSIPLTWVTLADSHSLRSFQAQMLQETFPNLFKLGQILLCSRRPCLMTFVVLTRLLCYVCRHFSVVLSFLNANCILIHFLIPRKQQSIWHILLKA